MGGAKDDNMNFKKEGVCQNMTIDENSESDDVIYGWSIKIQLSKIECFKNGQMNKVWLEIKFWFWFVCSKFWKFVNEISTDYWGQAATI